MGRSTDPYGVSTPEVGGDVGVNEGAMWWVPVSPAAGTAVCNGSVRILVEVRHKSVVGQVVAVVLNGGHVGSGRWCVLRAEVIPWCVGGSVVDSVPGNVLGV